LWSLLTQFFNGGPHFKTRPSWHGRRKNDKSVKTFQSQKKDEMFRQRTE
jgi:hypothetical protein